ncbi:hypothetical protein DFJ74DRAFT_664441 [Hyaloraphidium curvatum]|nr:hypothetical protein DFJ74DRAFT_664441 [Hyaloraphidium curvatum]
MTTLSEDAYARQVLGMESIELDFGTNGMYGMELGAQIQMLAASADRFPAAAKLLRGKAAGLETARLPSMSTICRGFAAHCAANGLKEGDFDLAGPMQWGVLAAYQAEDEREGVSGTAPLSAAPGLRCIELTGGSLYAPIVPPRVIRNGLPGRRRSAASHGSMESQGHGLQVAANFVLEIDVIRPMMVRYLKPEPGAAPSAPPRFPCISCGGYTGRFRTLLNQLGAPGAAVPGMLFLVAVPACDGQSCYKAATRTVNRIIDSSLSFLEPERRPGPTQIPCASCMKTVAKTEMKRCAACKRTVYCSKECQKVHWKQHKPLCEAYKIAEAEGKADP